MRIDILSAVPELLESFFTHSILKRAQAAGKAEVVLHNLRDYATNKHKKLDDTPFGGGAGMVMMIEPVAACIEHLQSERTYDDVIYTAPDGELFSQPIANRMALQTNFIILCGHYKGIDERIREHLITKEISIGDYVLTGGELAAAVMADAVIRLLPGVVGDETSVLSDSFQAGLVAPPVYTKPAEWRGHGVPAVLTGGNHAAVEEWRQEQALERTRQRRPGLLEE
jgi:tRNA (guanine37-N1)-methyltransferase